MIIPVPLLSHLTFCVGTEPLGVVRIEGELSELARMNMGVEKAVHVLNPPEKDSRPRNRVKTGLCWFWSEGESRGQRPVFRSEPLVLTCGFRQVAWAADVSSEGTLQGYLRGSQMWSILKLRGQSFSASCHSTSSRGLEEPPMGGHCPPLDTLSLFLSASLPLPLPPFVLPSLPLPFLGQSALLGPNLSL